MLEPVEASRQGRNPALPVAALSKGVKMSRHFGHQVVLSILIKYSSSNPDHQVDSKLQDRNHFPVLRSLVGFQCTNCTRRKRCWEARTSRRIFVPLFALERQRMAEVYRAVGQYPVTLANPKMTSLVELLGCSLPIVWIQYLVITAIPWVRSRLELVHLRRLTASPAAAVALVSQLSAKAFGGHRCAIRCASQLKPGSPGMVEEKTKKSETTNQYVFIHILPRNPKHGKEVCFC